MMPRSFEDAGLPQVGESHPSREAFAIFLDGLLDIMEHQKPERWWASVYRYLVKSKRQLDRLDPLVKRFLDRNIDAALEVIAEETRRSSGEDPTVAAQSVIHHFAELLASPPLEQKESMDVHHLSLEMILSDTEHFSLCDVPEIDSRTFEVIRVFKGLRVRASENDDWSTFILPSSDQIWHKGGAPRVVLKIMAGAPLETVQVELPPNDVDVIGVGDKGEIIQQAEEMGVDPAGVEMVPSLDFSQLMLERDVNLNQCFLGQNGLVYSDDAWEAAQTGHMKLASAERGLYGSEVFFYKGAKLTKNRGLFRLMKFVAEGKARSFEFTPLNEQINFGIYWLVLARKLASKKNAGALLNRLFELGCRTGQVREDEKDIYAVLERVHEEYPFFRFDDHQLDEAGVARWLAGKVGKLADKRFRQDEKIGLNFDFVRKPGDLDPYEVSLDGYEDDPKEAARIASSWHQFVERAQKRSEEAEGSQLN